MKRWRGMVALVAEGVEQGSRAIERIQKETAARPFGILERLPVAIAAPARVVHAAHDATVSTVHLTIRFVNATARSTIDTALSLSDRDDT